MEKPTLQDVPLITKYANNPSVSSTTLNIPHSYTEADAIFWLNSANQGFRKKSQFTFAIKSRVDKKFVGGIGLKLDSGINMASLGYWVAEPFWGKGIATEAVSGILRFGFKELRLNKIYATYLIENPASGKVMQKKWNGRRRSIEKSCTCWRGIPYTSSVQVDKKRI